MLRSALFSKMKAWNPNGKLCGRMDVQNLSVLERYILDGMSQIHGALTATTPHELSNTPIKSNSPHKEGHTKTPIIKIQGTNGHSVYPPTASTAPTHNHNPNIWPSQSHDGMGSMGSMGVRIGQNMVLRLSKY